MRNMDKNRNENTNNDPNEARFPISFGIFPDILFRDKFLNNCNKNSIFH